jgi:Protein of unknown function (DUF4236)
MGFRFRRTFTLLPGVRLNLSKSGLSASIGPRGLHYTIGAKGTRTTVGLPGSGISYTEFHGYRHRQAPPRRHWFLHFLLWLGVLAIAFAIVVAMLSPAKAKTFPEVQSDQVVSRAASPGPHRQGRY